MTGQPPADAVILAVTGLHGPADATAVQAALMRCDPAVRLWADWPRGLVAVQTDWPPEMLRVAVQDAGFVAAWLAHPPSGAGAGGAATAVFRVIGFGLAGFVLGALAGAAAGMSHASLAPACNSPGDSGGCAMGLPMVATGAGLLGAAAGAALAATGLLRGRKPSPLSTRHHRIG